MSVNGIWKVEMYGLYGWQPVATAFLEDGQYRAGSGDHYGVGTYKVSGNQIKVSTAAVQHGQVRAVFGKSEKKMNIKLEGKIEGDKINGKARDEKGKHKIALRMTRLADLP